MRQGFLGEGGSRMAQDGLLGNRSFDCAQDDKLTSHLEVNQKDEVIGEMDGQLFAVTSDFFDFLTNKFFGVTRKRPAKAGRFRTKDF